MREHLWSAAALAVLVALGFFLFPGHTYLQSDSQIYIPILERLFDPSLFRNELIARHPHVSFTLYDEFAIGLRKLTGWGFRDVLQLQQVIFRFCALLGVYLIALSLGLGRASAVLAAALFGLGATIMGPAVLTFEYEPQPRGNAVALTMLAVGLVAANKHLWAGCAAGLGFLYHVPAVWPFWAAYFVVALWPSEPLQMQRRIRALAPMAGCVLVMLVFSQLQQAPSKQQLFARIDAEWESLMRMRASYNWVSAWRKEIFWHYALLWAASLAAVWRLRPQLRPDLKMLALLMPALGMLSVPASYLLLENLKWSLIPQVQPARSLLYVVAFAVILAAAAALAAARQRRWWESAMWLIVVLAPPSATRTLDYLWKWSSAANRRAALTVLGMALLMAAALDVAMRLRRGWIVLGCLAVAPVFAVPFFSGVRNYPNAHHAELDELIAWARSKTPVDAVFLFPDAGRAQHMGIFRAQALRAVYCDWKGGGQINFLRAFMTEWWPRWQKTMQPDFVRERIERYRPFGIDYIVVFRKNAVRDATPVFENKLYLVYAVP